MPYTFRLLANSLGCAVLLWFALLPNLLGLHKVLGRVPIFWKCFGTCGIYMSCSLYLFMFVSCARSLARHAELVNVVVTRLTYYPNLNLHFSCLRRTSFCYILFLNVFWVSICLCRALSALPSFLFLHSLLHFYLLSSALPWYQPLPNLSLFYGAIAALSLRPVFSNPVLAQFKTTCYEMKVHLLFSATWRFHCYPLCQ